MKITLEFVANKALDGRVPVKTGESFAYKHGRLTTAVFDFDQEKNPEGMAASNDPVLPEWAAAAMVRSCEISLERASWDGSELSWGDVETDEVDLALKISSTTGQGTPAGQLLQHLLETYGETIRALAARK